MGILCPFLLSSYVQLTYLFKSFCLQKHKTKTSTKPSTSQYKQVPRYKPSTNNQTQSQLTNNDETMDHVPGHCGISGFHSATLPVT